MTKCRNIEPLTCLRGNRRDFLMLGAAAGIGLVLSDSHAQTQSVHELQGTAFRNRELITPATRINPGDWVSVSHGSSLTFSVGQDVYRLRGGTSLKLEASGNSATGLYLLTGALLGVFGQGAKTIYTRSAIIGIRGTGLYIDNKPTQTYLCTCYGETELQLPGLGNRSYTATHHKAVMISTPDGEKPDIQDAAAPEGHTDDELRKSESYVGRTVPFDT